MVNMFDRFRRKSSQHETEEKAVKEAQRRAAFEAMCNKDSRVESSEVLDKSKFDLHNCPDKPVVVDTADFAPPPRPKWEYEKVDRVSSNKRLSVDEENRRAVFAGMYGDKNGENVGHDAEVVDVDFNRLANHPAPQVAEDLDKPKELKFPVIDLHLNPRPDVVAANPRYREKRDSFVEAYGNVDMKE
jgi:hypothetical protein